MLLIIIRILNDNDSYLQVKKLTLEIKLTPETQSKN